MVGSSGTILCRPRFGEDYWKAFRAARRQQLESLSGDAQVQGRAGWLHSWIGMEPATMEKLMERKW